MEGGGGGGEGGGGSERCHFLTSLGDSEKCWVISAVEDAAWRRSWISYDNTVTVIELVIIAQSPSPFPRVWVGNC